MSMMSQLPPRPLMFVLETRPAQSVQIVVEFGGDYAPGDDVVVYWDEGVGRFTLEQVPEDADFPKGKIIGPEDHIFIHQDLISPEGREGHIPDPTRDELRGKDLQLYGWPPRKPGEMSPIEARLQELEKEADRLRVKVESVTRRKKAK